MEKSSVMTAQEWREKGYEEFNRGNWREASSHYTNALQLVKEDNAEKAVYYKDRAAAYLHLHDYEKVIQDCDSALKIFCNEALHRRCQALEALERFEEAYRDAEFIISFDPNNKVIQPVVARLHEIIQKRRNKNKSVNSKVSQLLDLAFNVSEDNENRETAMDNLQVLTRERAGAEEIFKKENLSKITQLDVKVERNEKMICSAIRIVGKLCKNNFSQTEFIMTEVLPWCLKMTNSTSTERVNATTYCLQNILHTYSGTNNKFNSKLVEALCEAHKKEIDTILPCLLNIITSTSITGLARDALIEFITRNINYAALNWAKQLVEFGCVQILLEVASEMKEYKYEFSLDITSSTRTVIGVCLAKIYENYNCGMYRYDDKKAFIDAIDKFIEDKLLKSDTESKVRAVLAITTLILGPLDVARVIIVKYWILEMILDMSKTDDVLQKKVYCECIVAAVTKYDRDNVLISRSIDILKDLCHSKDDSIRIRALVGLCKLSRFGELREYIANSVPFANGATKTLAEVCRRCLINPKKEENTIKWAVEGLSYLTFDAEVKEELIEDRQAVQVMIELAKTDDQSILCGVLTTLVNLCNAYDYDEQEHIPEMIELQFVRRFFGKDLAKNDSDSDDDDDDDEERRCALAIAGVTRALVNLTYKMDNQNCKELIARVFNAICIPEEVRVIVVEQGGTKALLSLVQDGTDQGKKHASRALVRLGLTIHPKIAFPGQTIMEVVRPIIKLLNLSETDLSSSESVNNENYEVLIALCRLASVNDTMRKDIFHEFGGFERFQRCLFEEDYIVKRKSAQLLNNCVLCREVAFQCFKEISNTYDIDYLELLYEEDEDEDTMEALAGTVSMLTAVSEEACEEVLDFFERWDSSLHILRFLLTNLNDDIKRRGIEIVLNMVRSAKEIAAKLMTTDIMKLLKALSNNHNVEIEIKELAFLALNTATEWNKLSYRGL